ncbi:FecR family protein [uncultured Chitinophaga sp.]|jgi:Fe2+-dicitrate sensor, membrane component|uniref:FecR family protein n=1 Tax=uncultured Chitinophaga sp. TaxID=339340 RepID=UPI00262301B7|nr:FecR family protein [uncultured Chitinophaga sp.]
MSGTVERLAYLYQQYIDGACTAEELQEFFEYVRMPEMRQALRGLATGHLEHLSPGNELPEVNWDDMYNRIMQQEKPVAAGKKGIVKRLFTRPVVAAAVVTLVASAGIWALLTRKPQAQQLTIAERFRNDIPPGSNKAILTLANGLSFALHDMDDNSRQQLASGNFFRLDSGELVYNNVPAVRTPGYNKLTTPRGGQFKLILPDGSRIWLNAASSITYPLAFGPGERKVAITGEAYLEVAKNAASPFKVLVNGMEIVVLGTKFNINAYTNEPVINTTLLEGAVKIIKGDNSCLLKPGEQLQVSRDGGFSVKNEVDTASVIAWKDGMFSFNDEDIASIMRQVNRWYDAQIVYEARIPHHFIGTIPRNVQVSRLLTMLELTGRLRFKIDGRKITVTEP